MRNLLNPKWLFIINTLPIIVFFFLFYGQFSIIKTLLDEEGIKLWKTFAFTLGILGLLNFGYAIYMTIKKQNLTVIYSFIALFVYITYIYLYGYHLDKIIPFNIPQWMLTENIFLYVGTFLMPTLVYSIFILILEFTSVKKEHHALINFIIAIAIPILGYLFTQIILPLWKKHDTEINIHAILILIIISTLIFIFFIVRSVFIIATKKAASWQKYQLVWKIPVTIILPIIGLCLNNGHLFKSFTNIKPEIFGDFKNSLFYILAFVNGILLCLPNIENKFYRLFLLIGRSVFFAYTFYFFLVFLPFLPLSIFAIIAFGVGILLLVPLLLFVIHIIEIQKDIYFLKKLYTKKLIIGISLLSFLVIPTCITLTYLKDKSVLNQTLSYLYSPDYSKNYNIDKKSLHKTLNVIKKHKKNERLPIFTSQTPYLTSYYNWLVLDNLTLSESKINHIEKVFYGKNSVNIIQENTQKENTEITNISTKSAYDQSQKAWKTWVDLEITNKNQGDWLTEYATTIDLPEGCWISDYYLFVENKKEFGILAEKKSAMWVFSNIKNQNRDPGILHYLTGNKVAFNVFPFSKNEVRKTGIQFLHKEPIQLRIDNHFIELGNAEQTIADKIESENFVYVSKKHKQTLKTVRRKPYFHFLVDISKDQKMNLNDFIKRIDNVVENNKELADNAHISFVNSYVNTFSMANDWKQKLKSQNFEGGFYLERAINKALFNAYGDASYPVFVVVTDSIKKAVLDKDFSDFEFAFPEINFFYNLSDYGALQEHSLVKNPLECQPEILRECMFCETVLEYKISDNSIAYLPNNSQASIILKKDIFNITESEIKEKDWQSALAMQAKWRSQILHPETSGKDWINLVKSSFVSKIMTPVTSYLVVENEAQKAILKKKQAQVLSGNKDLDLNDETQRMSEPSLWGVLILFGLLIFYHKKHNKKTIS